MSELAFPVLGALMVFLLAVPAMTALSKALLVLRRRATRHLPRFGTTSTWLVIVAPVVAPVAWFVSAALHQYEPGVAVVACLYDSLGSEACHDALAFASLVTSLLVGAFVRRARREWAAGRSSACPLPPSSGPGRRLAHLCSQHAGLEGLRVVAVSDADVPICTRGLLRPRVEVSAAWMASLDDDALVGALFHEAEHARALDPLRFFVASACLSVNPLAPLLRAELGRWRLAREAACDEAAVRTGGKPLPLAHAIVSAARKGARRSPAWVASLGEGGTDDVHVRVGLLMMGRADGRWAWTRRDAPFVMLAAMIGMVATLPHVLGSGPLDTIHLGIERALVVLGLQ